MTLPRQDAVPGGIKRRREEDCSSISQNLPASSVSPLKMIRRSKTKSSEKARKMKPAKQLSADPLLSCRVFCNICDRLYFLSGLRKHVAHKHSITYTEYKLRHGGEPKRQIINTVYHPCRLCKKVVLLDTTELGKHLKEHKLGYTQYVKEHMKKGSGLINSKTVPACSSTSRKVAPTQSKVKPPVPATPSGPRTRSQSKISSVQTFTSTSSSPSKIESGLKKVCK